MRIFYVAQTTPNEIDLPGSRLWHANLYLPLRDLGHELVTLPPELPSYDWLPRGYAVDTRVAANRCEIARRRPQFSEQLLLAVERAHRDRPIDLLFTYFASPHVEPDVIRRIGAMGIRTANWYCNASYQFHLVREIAPAYDHCLVPEKFRLEDYRAAGANPVYCQEAANPNVYHPYDLAPEFDVTFVGQKYGTRPQLISRLIDAGVDVRAWGPNWLSRPDTRPAWRRLAGAARRGVLRAAGVGRAAGGDPPIPPERLGPALTDEELVRMYSRSRLSLGFSAVAEQPADRSPPIKQVRLRDFEATMSGGCYLVEYFEELTEFFEPDREIICFSDGAELVEKAKYYLKHEADRERVRQAGRARALAEHTWQRRFEQVFKTIGLG